MDATLYLTLAGLALLDSLNPFSVAAQAYLLGTPRPMRRSLAFLAGTFATYFVGGLLLLQGWLAFFARLLPLLPGWAPAAAEVAAGAGLAAVGAWMWRRGGGGVAFRPPADLSVRAAVVFAAASTAADLSSALPYFAAVSRIAAAGGNTAAKLLPLVWYNLLYVLPLAALIAAYAALGPDRSAAVFGQVRQAVDWAFAKLLPPLVLLSGVALIADGVRRLV